MTLLASPIISRTAHRETPNAGRPAVMRGTQTDNRAELYSDARNGTIFATRPFRERVTVRVRVRNAGGRIVIGCGFNRPVALLDNPARFKFLACRSVLGGLYDAANNVTDLLKMLLGFGALLHGGNQSRGKVGNVRKGFGEIRNVEC